MFGDFFAKRHCICRVGQNRIYPPYMTVYLVISLPKIPLHCICMVLANPMYIHRVYKYIIIYMVLANPMHVSKR